MGTILAYFLFLSCFLALFYKGDKHIRAYRIIRGEKYKGYFKEVFLTGQFFPFSVILAQPIPFVYFGEHTIDEDARFEINKGNKALYLFWIIIVSTFVFGFLSSGAI